MNAKEILSAFYKGAGIPSDVSVVGYRAQRTEDMICDCDSDGECCGD